MNWFRGSWTIDPHVWDREEAMIEMVRQFILEGKVSRLIAYTLRKRIMKAR